MPITKQCRITWTPFIIRDEDIALLEKISPVIAGKKYPLPLPTLCPTERLRRRLVWRNEKHLYKRKCDATGKQVVSTYSSDHDKSGQAIQPPIYDQKVWRSDSWNPMEYGKEFDFKRSFFEQFHELQGSVPHMSIMVSHCENCEYAPYSFQSKDCYMSVSTVDAENILYSYQAIHSKNLVDCALMYSSEQCYESIYGVNLHSCYWTSNCQDANYLYLCDDCEWCDHCIACSWLHQVSYHILNQAVSKEVFEQEKTKILLNKASYEEKYHQLSSQRCDEYNINCENCVGNHLQNCKNAYHCFEAEHLEDCAYSFPLPQGARDCSDTNYSPNTERVYESFSGCNDSHSGFILFSWDVKRSWYVDECYYSQDLFGCVGLRNKQYCIFNKQYTREEYEKRVPRIIEHMQSVWERGEFFPMELSHYAYNETIAQDFFPFSQEEAQKQWLQRYDESYKIQIPTGTTTLYAKDLKHDYDEDLLDKVFLCEVSWKPYRIIKQELAFYAFHRLPLPRFHPHIRHARRLEERNKSLIYR